MDMIAWGENLSTGVKEIDDDHKELIECYNKLSGEYVSGSNVAEVNDMLVSLAEHTKSHFQREESLMDKEGYPDAASHKEEHHALLKSVAMLLNKVGSEGHHSLGTYTLPFLRSWLVNHILDADKDLAQYLLRPVIRQESRDAPDRSAVSPIARNWSETHLI